MLISYVNGDYVTKPVVSVFDRGFVIGDGVYDSARTFGGRIFKLDQHLERLGRSMRYIEIDPDPYASEIRRATEEVVARNMEEILTVGDAWGDPDHHPGVARRRRRVRVRLGGRTSRRVPPDDRGHRAAAELQGLRALVSRRGRSRRVSPDPSHERTVRSTGEVDGQGQLLACRTESRPHEQPSCARGEGVYRAVPRRRLDRRGIGGKPVRRHRGPTRAPAPPLRARGHQHRDSLRVGAENKVWRPKRDRSPSTTL